MKDSWMLSFHDWYDGISQQYAPDRANSIYLLLWVRKWQV